ncbi:hypothetical protein SAMN05443144_1154 [Fodinibius roseus]|uniref:Uncharacterized protein n=1 Tax=Fodinibius roseus TaxID=1194090 RepID=A0A1M5FER0_9BACT|nr:hypothetical protein SAMN05443144_1154 [Fodinibius roseus]
MASTSHKQIIDEIEYVLISYIFINIIFNKYSKKKLEFISKIQHHPMLKMFKVLILH